MLLRAFTTLMLCLQLSACGFHLRGPSSFTLPFNTLFLQSANDYTPFIHELKNAIQANHLMIADTADQAELTLQIVSETTDKQILSLSGAGRVIEYRLQYRVSLRAFDKQHQEWLAPQEITLQRNLPYDDTQILAKQQEEALLYQNMHTDAIEQILRRLSHSHAPQ